MYREETQQKTLKYYKLMEDLKKQILEGEFKPKDKLPSENELAARYQVSRQTVRKALSILENAGFIYAEHGRGTFCSELPVHNRNSKNIAVIITYLSDYIFPRVIQGIDSCLTDRGYSIILKNTHNSRSREARCLEDLLQKDIDGIIIEPSKSQIYCRHMSLYHKLDEMGVPYVFIQGCFAQMSHKPSVLMDDCKGGYMITRRLISLGHKNIAGIFKSDDIQGQNRHKGYAMALQEAGLPYDPEKVVWFYTEDWKVHPYESVRRMIERGVKMDGIVCYNDQIAVRVIKALADAGLRVPEDISVTGYDNSNMASNGGVNLTTIAHPQDELGKMAAELLVDLIQNKDPGREDTKILIEPRIVEGDSCMKRN